MSDSMQPDAPNADISAQNGRKFRKQRARANRGSTRDESLFVGTDPESEESEGNDKTYRQAKGGPRLSAAQRRIVLQILAKYEIIAIAMQVLHRDYPEIPSVTDRTLRTLRAQHRQTIADLLLPLNREALITGLAQREQRIRQLTYQYDRLVSIQAATDERARAAGQASDPQLGIVNRLCTLLNYIALESGDRSELHTTDRAAPGPVTPVQSQVTVDPARRAAVAAMIDRLVEERMALREAIRLSPPLPKLLDNGQV